MRFDLRFKEAALHEWKRLDGSIREQFKKKLTEGLENLSVPSAKLAGHPAATRSSSEAWAAAWCMRCAMLRWL